MKKSSKIVLGLIIVLLISIIGVGVYFVLKFNNDTNKKIDDLAIKLEQNTKIVENINNVKVETNNNAINSSSKNESKSIEQFSKKDLYVSSFYLGGSSKDIETNYANEKFTKKAYTEGTSGKNIMDRDYTNLGLKVRYTYSDSNSGEGTIVNIELYGSSKLQTARGIMIGSTREEILNAYSSDSILKHEQLDKNEIAVGIPGTDPIYGSSKDGIGTIHFYTENGKVTKILVANAVAE